MNKEKMEAKCDSLCDWLEESNWDTHISKTGRDMILEVLLQVQRETRSEVVEECARVAESICQHPKEFKCEFGDAPKLIAAEIRSGNIHYHKSSGLLNEALLICQFLLLHRDFNDEGKRVSSLVDQINSYFSEINTGRDTVHEPQGRSLASNLSEGKPTETGGHS